jgi:hypothetical protein
MRISAARKKSPKNHETYRELSGTRIKRVFDMLGPQCRKPVLWSYT